NNDYFSLERSDDAVNFIEIARVAGAGNSIEPIDYSYTDYGIHGGDNYYRLVQVDYDGTRTVSEIVVANCIEPEVGEPDVQAYPNPFSSDLTVVLDNFGNRAATIEVYDMLGKLIYIQKADAPQNSYETILNLSNLPPAAYTVRVSTNDFVINKNVVKQ
ncbi:MAG: T9SS type A sorting domain-containing protein, partial [Bacteroidales bacterium]|nr:T9SS type A sorting domain-containing protein [Bacteroidales bacterium]